MENVGVDLPPSLCLPSGAQGREELAALRLHRPLPALLLPPGSESGRLRRQSGGADQLGDQDPGGGAERGRAGSDPKDRRDSHIWRSYI